MPEIKKRSYKSVTRNSQAIQTKKRILAAARKLFELEGFEFVTIEKIDQRAEVSIPTVYSLFQSKSGVLKALMDEAFPTDQFDDLVEKSIQEKSPLKRLAISAKIARQMYDAEKAQMNIFRSAAVLGPEFKELEKEQEMRRYERQKVTIQAMVDEKSLSKGLNATKARDLLWAFTGRDLYRMFVIEQGWTSNAYEKWLASLLIKTLTDENV